MSHTAHRAEANQGRRIHQDGVVADPETGEIIMTDEQEHRQDPSACLPAELKEAEASLPEPPRQTPIARLLERAADEGDLAGMLEICDQISRTNFIPGQFRGKPSDVLVAIEMGQSIGLRPLVALQLISVINNKPALYGDGAIAVVKARGGRVFEQELRDPETGKFLGVRCIARRAGHPDVEQIFMLEDAQDAGLLDNLKSTDPWKRYPRRMCRFRARGYALRDQFADWLHGVALTEDADSAEFIDLDPADWEFSPPPAGTASTSSPAQQNKAASAPRASTGKGKAAPDRAEGKPIYDAAAIQRRLQDAKSVDQVNEIMDVLSGDREYFEPQVHKDLMAACRETVRAITQG